jgi:hypothetical protein
MKKLIISLVFISSLLFMANQTGANIPTPTVTPYLSPSQGGNPYVPQGQLGPAISRDAIPISSLANGGTGWMDNSYGNYSTPYQVNSWQAQQVPPGYSTGTPNPTPVPTPTPPSNQNGPWNNYGYGPDNRSGMSGGHNVGDIVNGYRWDGTQWTQEGGGGGGDQAAAIKAQEDANILAAQHEYDYLNAQLEGRKTDINNAYNTGIGDINNQIAQTKSVYDFGRGDLQTGYDRANATNYQNYLTTQRNNRELARSLGSGTSSAYLDMQGKTNNTFSTNEAQMQADLTNRLNKLDSDWAAANQFATAKKAELANNLESAMKSIVLDQNATDFRKADAINQLRSQAQSQLATLQTQLNQFQQNLQMQREYYASIANQMKTNSTGYAPNTSYIQANLPGQQQTFSLSGIDTKKYQ